MAWGSGQCGRPHREIRDRTLCHRLHGDTALVNDRAIMRGIISALMHHDLTWPNSRTVRGQEPMNHKKSPEEYRRLADKCRETARTVSAENGRADLLAMAQTWDLIADRLEASRADDERSAITDHDSPAVNVKPAPIGSQTGSI